MTAHSTHWFFPSTQSGQEYGLNDAGIAWFSDGSSQSFAREVIQNSLDASDGSGAPVRVGFTLMQVPRSDIPQMDELEKVVTSCLEYTKKICKTPREFSENGKALFESAIALARAPTIAVLRARDENTTGLEGSDSEKNSAWDRLIRQQGAPSLHGAGGGSYGIGQKAPFAVSGLRTVLYGTRTTEGVAFIGKSIWRSYPDVDQEDDMRQHIGFWGAAARKGVTALTEEAMIPPPFRRSNVGCDLFILGFQPDPGWEHLLVDAVIENFFAAISANRLVVTVDGGAATALEVSSATIIPLIDQRLAAIRAAARTKGGQESAEKGLGRTRFYLDALVAPAGGKPFEDIHPKLGKLQLFVTRNPEAPCRVAYMRKPRILVFDQSNKILAGYAAVFVCETDSGNEILRAFELPDHRSWAKKVAGRDSIMRDLYAFVRKTLEQLAIADSSEAQDVPDLSRYLPEDAPDVGKRRGGLKPAAMTAENETGKLEQPDGPVKTRPRKSVTRPAKSLERRDPRADEEEEGDNTVAVGGNIEPENTGGSGPGGSAPNGPSSTKPHEPGNTGGDGDQAGGGVRPNGDDTVVQPGTSGARYPQLRGVDVRFRAYYSESEAAMRLVLISKRRGSADFDLSAAGEDTSYPLVIESIEEVTAVGRVPASTNASRLTKVSFEKHQRREFIVKTKPNRKFALSAEVAHAI